MKKFRQTGMLLSTLVGMMGAASCTAFHEEDGEGGFAAGNGVPVTFTVSVPGAAQTVGKTYALSATDEEEVLNIEALIFQVTSGGDTVYRTRRSVEYNEITSLNSLKRFTINLPESPDEYQIVLIANPKTFGKDIMEDVANKNLEGYSKSDVLSQLINESPRGSGKLIAYPGTTIPMWGETEPFSVPNSITQTVKLVRMVAKVSVLVDAAVLQNFRLQSISVYNVYNKGYAAGGMPTLVPPGATRQTIVYESPEVRESGCENEIYLFESNNSGTMTMDKRTCLVLRAAYSTGIYSYYRVDFVKNEGGVDTYMDILRNHHYKVRVNKITGIGYATLEEALAKRPFNIEALVIEWNDTDKNITSMFTDGRYMLGLSAVDYDLDGSKYDVDDFENQLIIKTDHPDGWKIVSIIDDATRAEINTQTGWLRESQRTEAPPYSLVHLLTEENNSLVPRSATVTIEAGSITATIKVKQSDRQTGRLMITNAYGPFKELTELVFTGASPAPQEFRVTWSPKDMECDIDSICPFNTDPFPYGGTGLRLGEPGYAVSTVVGIGTPGSRVFKVQPDASKAPTGSDESSTLIVVTLPIGSRPSKSILLRYISEYGLETDGLLPAYPAEGGRPYTFNIKSNATWKITDIVGNTDGLITWQRYPEKGGVESSKTLTPFTFTPTPGKGGVVTIVFEYNNGTKKSIDIRITPTVYYVSETGNDTQDGITLGTARATMQATLDSIRDKQNQSPSWWPKDNGYIDKPATIVVSGTIKNDGTGTNGNMVNVIQSLPDIILKGDPTKPDTLDAQHFGSVMAISLNRTVYLDSEGDLVLKGGNGNINSLGGGVHVYSGGTFVMNGGTITDCDAPGGGGVFTAGTFEMTGGTISGDSALYGGGVIVDEYGKFSMKKGTIRTNKAYRSGTNGGYGGGIYVRPNGNFVMSGGTVYGVKKYDSNDAETATANKNIAEVSGSSLYIGGAATTATYSGVTTPAGISNGNIIASGYTFTHHTLPSKINEPKPVWYVYEGGKDYADGMSVETAKATPQDAVTSIAAAHAAIPITTDATILVSDTVTTASGATGPLVDINGASATYPPITLRGASVAEWTNYIAGALNANKITDAYVLFVANNSSSVTLGGNLTLMGGTKPVTGGAGGANVINGTLILDGAIISGNNGDYGGGVHVWTGGTFNMNSGTITENIASSAGGGVFVAGGGIFKMTGGTIGGGAIGDNTKMHGNRGLTDGGGGVFVQALGKFDKVGGGTIFGWDETSAGADLDNNATVTAKGHAVWDATQALGSEAIDTPLLPANDHHSN